VVGAGISGLSAACYAAGSGRKTLVLEATERAGGCMHSHAFPALGDYWVEAGSHSCFNSYGNLLAILEAQGLLERATAKAKLRYRLWRDGRRRPALSALHPLELLTALPRLAGAQKAGASVRDYYAAVFGKKNYRDLLGPAFRSIVCQEADHFPAETLFRRKPRRKDVLRDFTLPAGLEEIPRALAATPGVTVHTEQAVTAAGGGGDGFTLHCADGSRYRASALTLALPPDRAAPLLDALAPDAAVAARGTGMAEIDSQLLVFDREDLTIEPLAGLISIDGPFLSAVSRDFLAHPTLRGFAFHYPGGALDETARINAACEALGVEPRRLKASTAVQHRLPALRPGHGERVAAIDRALAGSMLGVTGNWFLVVSLEDCVSRSREEHERRFGRLS
jgi:protoporphyrinogen oxidase